MTTTTTWATIPEARIKLVAERKRRYRGAGEGRHVNRAEVLAEIARAVLTDAAEERFYCLCLDTRNVPILLTLVSQGTLNQTLVHPREVFRAALLANAAAIVVFHNHPSGDPTPSREDVAITQKLRQAGAIMGVRLLDHVIIGAGMSFRSLATDGLGGLP